MTRSRRPGGARRWMARRRCPASTASWSSTRRGRAGPSGWRSASCEALDLDWDRFRQRLISAIADDPERPYYESWVAALESLVVDEGLASPDELSSLAGAGEIVDEPGMGRLEVFALPTDEAHPARDHHRPLRELVVADPVRPDHPGRRVRGAGQRPAPPHRRARRLCHRRARRLALPPLHRRAPRRSRPPREPRAGPSPALPPGRAVPRAPRRRARVVGAAPAQRRGRAADHGAAARTRSSTTTSSRCRSPTGPAWPAGTTSARPTSGLAPEHRDRTADRFHHT